MSDSIYQMVDQEHNAWVCNACGYLAQFEADGPYENGWSYCPHCGTPIAGKGDL